MVFNPWIQLNREYWVCSPPGFSVHGIFQARILEWVAVSFSHSSFLAGKTPWTEEPGRLQSLGSQRVRHNGTHTHTDIQGEIMRRALLKTPISGCKFFKDLSSDYFLNLSYCQPFLHAFCSNLRKNRSGWLNVFQRGMPFCIPSFNMLGLQVISILINTGTNTVVWF